jgi:tetratricopeptide (TPR) repeat protein
MSERSKRRHAGSRSSGEKRRPARPILDTHWRLALGALFLASLAWRLAYLARLSASPLSGTLRGDERVYWDWATFLLGHGFRGTNAFFLGPLYPYFLGVARLVLGSRVQSILVLQVVMGSVSVVLLADAAKKLSRTWVALFVGGVLAFYEMSVLFDGLILMESLVFLLEALLIWLWVRAVAKPSGFATFAVIGLVTGLIAEGRATGALLLVPCVWLAFRLSAKSRREPMLRMGIVIATFLVVMLPAALWNASASREFIPFTYNFGYNLYVGNNRDANGGYVFIAGKNQLGAAPEAGSDGGGEMDGRAYLEKTKGLKLTSAQSSSYWTHEAVQFMRAQPGLAAALVGNKFLLIWNHRETPQLESVDLFRREAGPLGLPLLGTFITLGVLGLIGWVFAEAIPIAGVTLRLYVLAITLGMLPFFVTDRYRIHLVPALAVLSAIGIDMLVRRMKNPAGGVARIVAVTVGAVALVAFPLPAQDARLTEWQLSRELGTRWLEQDRPDLAAQEFEQALALERSLGLARDPDRSVVEGRALLHFNYATALHKLGRTDEELVWLRAAAEEDPQNAHYLRTLADACFLSGQRQEGDSLIHQLSHLVGGEAEAAVSQGWEAAREGRRHEAEQYFRGAVAADQRMYGAWGALIRIQVEQSEWSAAESSLTLAANAGMPHPALLAHEGLLRAASGDAAGAQRALDAIPDAELEADRSLASVVATARRMISSSGAGARP